MATPPTLVQRDRTTALIAFGIVEIALGALCVLLMLLTVFGMAVLRQRTSAAVSPRTIVPGLAVYGVLAAGFVWLGIGSVRARRWARAIWICASAIWVAMGVISVPATWFVLGRMPQMAAAGGSAAVPPAVFGIVRIATIGFLILFMIVLPGTLFLFYRSPHVKATCERKDPVERWTDRCPLPLLALSLYAGLLALGALLALPFGGLYPLFGRFVTGPWGHALAVVTAVLWAVVGFGLYRRRVDAWWGALAMVLLTCVSGAITIWRAGFGLLYRQMGLQHAEQVASLANTGLFRWSALVNPLLLLAWLWLVRRYLRPLHAAPAAAPV